MIKKKNGFTLVEIIVVLLILAILAAISIPSMIGYVNEARESELIQEAHNVLVASKAESTKLYARGKLPSLTTDSDVHKEIMEKANIDGKLISISLNQKQTGSGDFIVQIDGKYIRYTDAKKEFTILDKAPSGNSSEQIRDTLLNDDFLSVINRYFALTSHPERLDSEGPNTGKELKELFESLGFNTDSFSYRIYKKYGGSSNTITISMEKLTKDNIGKSVEVIQYDYGNSSDFSKTPTIKKATVPVVSKTEKDKNGNSVTYPVFDLGNADWKSE